GVALGPGHLGVLASVGLATVTVHRRPRVGVLSTGDELVEPGKPLGPGQIRDSNRRSLLALVDRAGCEPVDLGLAADDEAVIRSAITAGVEACDAVVTSGGVSVGDFDYVKVVLDDLAPGAMRWMQVAIRPAKPLAFGTVAGTPVFGLPGNPVSSMVSFELFVRPALRLMMGRGEGERVRPSVMARAGEDFRRSPDGKLHLDRVVVRPGPDGRLVARSAGGQGSHVLTAMAAANGLALIGDGDGVAAGEELPVLLLDEL
ncbi:MAG TPA: molybdopterin molybdotransferase MoeA, partial [Acidimicrobiales bacterium]|nr:molybdopterin molybdotransferase MoeA [Acidimicrobiales bacterium]